MLFLLASGYLCRGFGLTSFQDQAEYLFHIGEDFETRLVSQLARCFLSEMPYFQAETITPRKKRVPTAS